MITNTEKQVISQTLKSIVEEIDTAHSRVNKKEVTLNLLLCITLLNPDKQVQLISRQSYTDQREEPTQPNEARTAE